MWCLPVYPDHGVRLVDRVDLHALLTVGAHRDDVTRCEVLELGDDVPCAGARQIVEDVVAVPAGPSEPDLDQPRPDLLRACGNSDRARGVERGAGHQLVAGQRMGHLVWCGPPRELPRTHIAGVDKRYRRGSQQGQESTRSHDHSLWCACSKEPGLKDPEVRGESSPVTRSTTAPYLFRPRPQRDNRQRTDTSAVRASPAAKRATSRLPVTGRINVSRPSECVQMRRGVGPQGIHRSIDRTEVGIAPPGTFSTTGQPAARSL